MKRDLVWEAKFDAACFAAIEAPYKAAIAACEEIRRLKDFADAQAAFYKKRQADQMAEFEALLAAHKAKSP